MRPAQGVTPCADMVSALHHSATSPATVAHSFQVFFQGFLLLVHAHVHVESHHGQSGMLVIWQAVVLSGVVSCDYQYSSAGMSTCPAIGAGVSAGCGKI